MKRIKILIITVAVLSGLFAPAVSVGATSALAERQACIGAGGTPTGNGGCATPGEPQTAQGIFKSIINALLFITSAVAIIVIIVSGIRFALSGGDNSTVTSAKNTMLYAVVGLVVAFAAYAIVDFVVFRL